MAAKIEEMIESSNRELEETFDEDVMSITLDDISDDMLENTSGPGTGSPDTEEEEEQEAEVEEEDEAEVEKEDDGPMPDGSVLGDEDELEAVARELDEADRKETSEEEPSDDGGPRKGAAREGMDSFTQWLKRMQDDPGDDKK